MTQATPPATQAGGDGCVTSPSIVPVDPVPTVFPGLSKVLHTSADPISYPPNGTDSLGNDLKWGMTDNYTRITNVSWDCPKQNRIGLTLLKDSTSSYPT